MNLRSRFLVFLLSIIGFVLIPVLFFAYFTVQKVLQPKFYTKAIIVSEIIPVYLTQNLQNSKKIPKSIKKNMELAKEDINKTIQTRLFPQIEMEIKHFVQYLKGHGQFPVFEFEMTLFKKNLIENMKKAGEKQKFTDKIFVKLLIGFINRIPNIFELQKYVDFSSLQLLIGSHRKGLTRFFKYKNFFWAFPLVFLFLFFFITFRVKLSFYYFSNLLLYSGFFFLLIFGFVFFLNPVVANMSSKLLYKVVPNFIYIPSPSFIALQRYLIKTFSLQGVISSSILVVVGILLSGQKDNNKTTKQEVIVQHQFTPVPQPTIPVPPQM